VAIAKVTGKTEVEFGTNTTVGEKYLGKNNSELRKQTISDIQTKLGKLEGARYNDKDTKFLTHAEAESLIKLAQKNGGKLPAEVEIFVDRPTCPACRGTEEDVGVGLSLLTELYGIKKLTVHDSYGTTYIIRPNQTTEVIK
jgi:MafB19-like deaminase